MPNSGNASCSLDVNKRKSLIVINQIAQLEALLYNVQALFDASVLAESFNIILGEVRDIFQCDDIFAQSVRHVQEQHPDNLGGVIENRNRHLAVLGSLLTHLAMLKGALIAFIEIYLTEEEKSTLGFQAGQLMFRPAYSGASGVLVEEENE